MTAVHHLHLLTILRFFLWSALGSLPDGTSFHPGETGSTFIGIMAFGIMAWMLPSSARAVFGSSKGLCDNGLEGLSMMELLTAVL